MAAILILPILISGFIICKKHPYYNLRLYRYDGQLLYLKAAHRGFIAVIISFFILFFLKCVIPQNINIYITSFEFSPITWISKELQHSKFIPNENATQYTWFLFISLFSVLIAHVWSFLAHTYYFGNDENKFTLLYNVFKESPLDLLFFESLSFGSTVMITMSSGKVYIGEINKCGDPNEKDGPNQEVSIIPILSGYRNKVDNSLNITNEYSIEGYDFSVVIPKNQIISVSNFDIEAYGKINNNILNGIDKTEEYDVVDADFEEYKNDNI